MKSLIAMLGLVGFLGCASGMPEWERRIEDQWKAQAKIEEQERAKAWEKQRRESELFLFARELKDAYEFPWVAAGIFIENGVPVDYAKLGAEFFDPETVIDLFGSGVSLDRVAEIQDSFTVHTEKDGFYVDVVPESDDLAGLLMSIEGLEADYVLKMKSWCDWSLANLHELKSKGVYPDYLDALGKLDFMECDDISEFFIGLDGTVEELMNYVSIVDENGVMRLSAAQIIKAKELGLGSSETKVALDIKDSYGFSMFEDFSSLEDLDLKGIRDLVKLYSEKGIHYQKNDVVDFVRDRIKVDYAAKMLSVDRELTGSQIYRMGSFGIEPEDLKRSYNGKPVALYFLPAKDDNGAFQTDLDKEFFTSLKDHYDLVVGVAATERDIYRGIVSNLDASLLIISGHGTKDKVELGEFMKDASAEHEEFYLDSSDEELEGYLSMLHKDAVVFLDSCKTGQRFARWVAQKAQGRFVIGARDSYASEGMKVTRWNPFRISIRNLKGENVTYERKGI